MNIGYACINMTLGEQTPRITTNRSMVKKTFTQKGISYASELALQNSRDLFEILKWNVKNGIKLFRISSDMLPWASEYNIEDMPDFQKISNILKGCGTYANDNGVRLTSHPGPFNVLVSPNPSQQQFQIQGLQAHAPYQIIHSSGKIVQSGKVAQANQLFDLEEAAGIYYFQTILNEQPVRVKIMLLD